MCQATRDIKNTVMVRDRFRQTVQTQIKLAPLLLLLKEQSDQGLHCLLFHLHHIEVSHCGLKFRVLIVK